MPERRDGDRNTEKVGGDGKGTGTREDVQNRPKSFAQGRVPEGETPRTRGRDTLDTVPKGEESRQSVGMSREDVTGGLGSLL